jgi:hypothetical protein
MFEDVNFAPLPSSFMAAGLLGIILILIYREALGTSWTFTLSLFFIIMLIASFLSLHYGPIPDDNY